MDNSFLIIFYLSGMYFVYHLKSFFFLFIECIVNTPYDTIDMWTITRLYVNLNYCFYSIMNENTGRQIDGHLIDLFLTNFFFPDVSWLS